MGIDEYNWQQVESIKEYRAEQGEWKRGIEKKKKQKLLNTSTDAIRARKTRTEANKLRDEMKVKSDVSSILNSIIDAVPVVVKSKRNIEEVSRHKERKELGEARTYTRSKGRTLNL